MVSFEENAKNVTFKYNFTWGQGILQHFTGEEIAPSPHPGYATGIMV